MSDDDDDDDDSVRIEYRTCFSLFIVFIMCQHGDARISVHPSLCLSITLWYCV